MSKDIEKKYPFLGKVSETEGLLTSTFAHSSPWKNANTSFQWLNFEYPRYHGHTDWEILIVLNDRIIHKINGGESVIHEGTACLIGPKDRHALHFPDKKPNQFQGLNFLIRDSYMKSVLDLYSPSTYDRLIKSKQVLTFSLSSTFLEDLTSSCLEIQGIDYSCTPQKEENCNILFHSLLLRFLKQSSEKTSISSDLASFIRSLNNPNISQETVKELQSNLPYSYSNLTRIFKKRVGCTITQYVNKIKLEHSKELLTTTDMTTLMIANLLHFESLSHFNHLFKKYFNMTPTQYKKEILNASKF